MPLRKIIGCALGLLLAVYGSLEVWLTRRSYDNPAKQRLCAAWLCPEEFSDARWAALDKASARGGASLAVKEQQRALRFDSASAFAWANLAEAEMNDRKIGPAKYCFQQALGAGPGNPAILFRAARFTLSLQDYQGTMQHLAAILRNPELTAYYQPVFLTYSRMGLPLEEVLNTGIPAIATAAQPFLQFWIAARRAAEADATWRWMTARSLVDDKTAGNYVSFLIGNNQPEHAAQVWARFNAPSEPKYRVLNWIFNGSFESDPKPSPLDWHIESNNAADVSRVDTSAHDGQWSLKLTLNGKENAEFRQVYQQAPVTPGRWRISAFFKLEGLTADQNLALHVYDAEQPARLDTSTGALSGTKAWEEVSRVFLVGPETKLLRIEIVRPKSPQPDPQSAGVAWIDSVELTPTR